ncbi:MAG: ribosomal-processing cysteine protease Prp [Acholeplasmataceae bacterium]|jgi:uncharacterized protein YsxB (DUF464 family)|nr:ribosomal-processing cysteine protease Prp [Acholeplasmataceae bacterium]
MIIYQVKEDLSEVEVKGHAEFAELGEDIVCASVSTAVILSANLIERLKEKENVELKEADGYFHLKVLKQTNNIKVIIQNLVWTLKELEKQYPHFIKYQKER